MQLLVHELGGRVEQAEVGEFGRSELTVTRAGRAAGGDAKGTDVLDVSPRHRLRAAARLHRAGVLHGLAGRGRRGPRAAASMASSSTPRWSTRPTARRSSRASSPRYAAVSAPGRPPRSPKTRSRAFASRWGTGASSAASPAGSTPRWPRCSCTAPIGDQLTCVFVDHGLMRKDEGEQVISAFSDTFRRAAGGGRRRAALP